MTYIPMANGSRWHATRHKLLATLCSSLWAVAVAAPPATAPAVASITSITLERGCFGCADSGLLVLRRDGAATHTRAGNARQGTADSTTQGRIAVGDFDQLAGLLVTQGFFQLQDNYEDATVRDGAWYRVAVTTVAIAAGANAGAPQANGKQVFSREAAGPAALQRVVAAIDAAKMRIRFAP